MPVILNRAAERFWQCYQDSPSGYPRWLHQIRLATDIEHERLYKAEFIAEVELPSSTTHFPWPIRVVETMEAFRECTKEKTPCLVVIVFEDNTFSEIKTKVTHFLVRQYDFIRTHQKSVRST